MLLLVLLLLPPAGFIGSRGYLCMHAAAMCAFSAYRATSVGKEGCSPPLGENQDQL